MPKKHLYVWGASDSGKNVSIRLKVMGIDIDAYIDSYKTGVFDDKRIITPEEVIPCDSYIYVAVKRYESVYTWLTQKGYKEGEEFVCIYKKMILSEAEYYRDNRFNCIDGRITAQNIKLSAGACIEIGEDCKFGKKIFLAVEDFSKVIFGDKCVIGDGVQIVCRNNSRVCFEAGCEIQEESYIGVTNNSMLTMDKEAKVGCHNSIKVFSNSEFKIGSKTDFDENFNARILNGSSVVIGDDCMFSYDISIRGDDGHPLLDLTDSDHIIDRPRKVRIGNHVWCGMNSIILPGTDLEDGSIIGAASVVTKKHEKNVLLVGNPAKMIRNNVTWERK